MDKKATPVVDTSRVNWIDYGKGFTIFLVVLGHVVLGLYESPHFESIDHFLWIAVQAIYVFHIPVFFALSGYFFKPQETLRDWLEFSKIKTIQLGVPYIFYNLLQFILQQIGGGSVRDSATLSDLLGIYKHPLGVSWYLYILWGILILTGFLSVFIKNKNYLFLLTISLSFL